ncbi:MAG: hypothetical protein JW717_10095 [Marinilabiliaceae bacterium]|nr:hypothetical protein [Marinilabiliaceae bacterium]
MLEIEGTDKEIIVHAANIYTLLTTIHVTSGGPVDIADEIGMQGIFDYIDEKCKNIINY